MTAIGTHSIESALDVELALLGSRPGQDIEVEVSRNGQPVTATLAVTQLSRTTPKPAVADRGWTTLGLRLAVTACRINR